MSMLTLICLLFGDDRGIDHGGSRNFVPHVAATARPRTRVLREVLRGRRAGLARSAARISGESVVLTEMSTGVMVIFFHGALITMRMASGSHHQLNSRRPLIRWLPPLSTLKPAPMTTSSFASAAARDPVPAPAPRWSTGRRPRASLHRDTCGSSRSGAARPCLSTALIVGVAAARGRASRRVVVPRRVPCALVSEHANMRFPQLGLLTGVDQRELGPLRPRGMCPYPVSSSIRSAHGGALLHLSVAGDDADANDVDLGAWTSIMRD